MISKKHLRLAMMETQKMEMVVIDFVKLKIAFTNLQFVQFVEMEIEIMVKSVINQI